MKVRYPRIAVIDNDTQADGLLACKLREFLPVEIDFYHALHEFMGTERETVSSKEYQMVIVDSCLLPNLIKNIRAIETLCDSNPQIVLATGIQTSKEQLEDLIDQGIRLRIIRKPIGPKSLEDYKNMVESAGVKFAESISRGEMRIDTPKLVYGSGVLARGIVRELVREKNSEKVIWYAPSIAEGEFEAAREKLGYEQVCKLKDIPLSNGKLIFCYHANQMFWNNPGFIIDASAVRRKLNFLREKKDRDSIEILEMLARDSLPRAKLIANEYKNANSDAIVFCLSNPPSVVALSLMKQISGIDPDKIVFASSDVRRLKTNIIRQADSAYLAGTHSSPILHLPFLKKGENRFDVIKRGDRGLYDNLRHNREMALKKWGGDVMLAYEKSEHAEEYLDTVAAVHEDLIRVRHFQMPEGLGYYAPSFGVYLFGPPRRLNLQRASFPKLDDEEQEYYEETLKKEKWIASKLKDMARQRKKLVKISL